MFLILAKPSFLRPMKSKNIPSGTAAVLDCIISGNPRPRITWYKENEPMKSSKRIMLSDQMLVIHEFTAGDVGSYTCHAANHLGSASQSARLELGIGNNGVSGRSGKSNSVNTDIIAMTVIIVFTATSFIWFVVFCFCRWKRKYNRSHATSPVRASDLSTLYCQQKEDLVPALPKDFVLRCNGKVVSCAPSQQSINDGSQTVRLCESAPLLNNINLKEVNNIEQAPPFIIPDSKYFRRKECSLDKLAQTETTTKPSSSSTTKDFISDDEDEDDQHDSGVLVHYRSGSLSGELQTPSRKGLRTPFVTIDTRDRRRKDLSKRLLKHKHSSSADETLSTINNNQANDLTKKKRLLSQSNPNNREEESRDQTYFTSSSGVESGVSSSTESLSNTISKASNTNNTADDSVFISTY